MGATSVRFDPALLPASPDLSLESSLWDLGGLTVCGIDEAGRGALAGPVTAAALIFPADPRIQTHLTGLLDSKALTPRQRDDWAPRIREFAIDYAVGSASSGEIDSIGILPATRLAAQRALDRLRVLPDHLILDYLFLPDNPLPQTSLIKGDARCLSIAAASVLAKVSRDNTMRALEETYPAYGLAVHKGYGTSLHRTALQAVGPSPVHRLSFSFLQGASDEMVQD